MGSIFSGLVQCGAWGCFDEFNRIEAPVLSVVSAQLKTIQSALIGMVKSFHFEGREISLNPMCGFFITMNPGYAGRLIRNPLNKNPVLTLCIFREDRAAR
jgi:dynein heavy chain, axonemal